MILQRYKELLTISVPATLSSLFVVIIIMLDTKMVSPLGTAAISAVSVATQPELFVFMVFTALGTATTVVVSHLYGQKSRQSANAVLVFTCALALGGAIVLGALVAIFAKPIMVVCSNQSDTMDMSVIFLRILMVGMVFQALSTVINAALRGVGDAKATLAANVTMGVVDIIFNYLLIEGHLGFPAWGVAGSALATTLGYFAGFIVSLGFLFRKDCFLSLRYYCANHVRISREDAREIWRNLSNVYLENILTRVGFLVSGMVVARLGSYETSIYSVGAQLLSLSFAFGDGIQAAVLALVGKSYGKRDRAACETCIRDSLRLGIAVSLIVAVSFIALGGPFFSLFSADENFITSGGVVALFVAAIAPFQITRIIRVSVMRSFGDVKTPRHIATISALVLDPPLSLLFSFGLGLGQWGLWIGTLLSQLAWFAMAEVTSRKAVREFPQRDGECAKPDAGAGPGESARPDGGVKSDEGAKSDEDARPGKDSGPDEAVRLDGDVKSGEDAKPGEDAKSNDGDELAS